MALKVKARVIMALLMFLLLFLGPTYIVGHGEGEITGSSFLGEWADFWVVRLAFNLFAYGSFAFVGYMVIRWARSTNYVERAGPGCTTNLLRLFVHGNEGAKSGLDEGPASKPTVPEKETSTMDTLLQLIYCTVGLLGCYLLWGYMQETIMTIKYGKTETSEGENFKDSTFLVFMNRILALLAATIYLIVTARSQPLHTAPFFKYSYSSFSNIMSSWFQYEALKFVSFPTQVLAKSCKVIAVMLMGKVMSKKTYAMYELTTAGMITLGVAIFTLFSKDSTKDGSSVTTISGLILLASYLTFDAFTSNWQGELFKTYHMSSIQMMAGVNLFSVCFTTVALLEQGGFFQSMAFIGRHSEFMFHIVILSICSAGGQLFIYHTINKFGAVVFTIIMTLRQAFAIIISCILFHHPLSGLSICGIVIVFIAVAIRMYCSQKARKQAAVAKATAVASGPSRV